MHGHEPSPFETRFALLRVTDHSTSFPH